MERTPRIVRREPQQRPGFSWRSLRPAELLDMFRSYLGLGKAAQMQPIDSPEALADFLNTRASFIAQTSLYGYLRTRMGLRYPELFQDDVFVVGINIAKWEVWLDCLADITVYAGSRIAQAHPREMPRVGALMEKLVDDIIEQTGRPADAGPDFADHARRVRERIGRTFWLAVADNEAAFTDSPASVVLWAPIDPGLKELDQEIVLNSVRFRWQEVRRTFKAHVVPDAVLGLATTGQQAD